MSFICLLFDSKVQCYTNFIILIFHHGLQWGNLKIITLKKKSNIDFLANKNYKKKKKKKKCLVEVVDDSGRVSQRL